MTLVKIIGLELIILNGSGFTRDTGHEASP